MTYQAIRDVLNSFFNLYGGAPPDAIEKLIESLQAATRFRIPRLPRDPYFMLEAHVAATRSTCDRGPELFLDPPRKGVGAVFVRENRIIAGGYNGSPPGEAHCNEINCPECEEVFEVEDLVPTAGQDLVTHGQLRGVQAIVCPACATPDLHGGHIMIDGHCLRTLHAEENAILQCALDGVSPRGATVYTTAGPCWDCAKRFLRVGIVRVVFGAPYESRYGLSGDARKLLHRNDILVEQLDVRGYLGG